MKMKKKKEKNNNNEFVMLLLVVVVHVITSFGLEYHRRGRYTYDEEERGY